MIGDDGTSSAGGGYGARLEALGNLSSIGLGAAAGAPWWGVGALVLFYPVIRNLPSYVLTLVPGQIAVAKTPSSPPIVRVT